MSKKKEIDPLEVFSILGWDLRDSGSQLQCACPFCGKDKMYVDPKKTTFSCRVCGTEGNNITVMDRMFRKVYQPAISFRDYATIVKVRTADGRFLPQEAYELDPNIGRDPETGRFVWVVRKPTGVPVSLRFWSPKLKDGKKQAVRALKGAHLGLLGAEALSDDDRSGEPVFITEGEWDRCALMWMLDQLEEDGIVLALPGANNFSPDWVPYFKDRVVIGLYDNDEPGRDGTVRCFKKINGIAKSLKFLHWDSTKEDGYDIDDLVKDHKTKLKTALSYLNANIRKEPTGKLDSAATGPLANAGTDREAEQAGLEPITVDQLHAAFGKWLKLENYDLLDITMACAWTLYLDGNPLWLFVVAPPSGSKSETIMPMSEWWRVHAFSTMTSKSLISGFQMPGNVDPSLMASLEGKRVVLAIKDLTPLLQGRQEERDEVFSILRDSYDGSITKVFGNGLRRSYSDLHFTIIAGVTPAIDATSNVSLGERFLKFRADRDTDRHDDIDRALRAIENCGQENEMRKELKSACVRALIRPFDPDMVPLCSPAMSRLIAELAYVVANIRAVAPTERGSDTQTMAPMSEAPPRLATQFVKLAQGLALHFEADRLEDPRVVRLLRRVALHTPNTVDAKVAQVLFHWHSELGQSMLQVSDRIHGLSRETISRTLQRFHRTSMLEMKLEGTARMYRFKDKMFEIIKRTGIFDDLPTSDVFYRKDLPVKRMMIRKRA